jgi:hypothetical protein
VGLVGQVLAYVFHGNVLVEPASIRVKCYIITSILQGSWVRCRAVGATIDVLNQVPYV